jgi:hypothetical protein
MPNDVSPSRFAPVFAVVVLLLIGALAPGHVATRAKKSKVSSSAGHRADKDKKTDARFQLASNPGPSGLGAYRDLGSWIDIYDAWPWAHPTLAVRKLHERGVRTIFLQTSNYGAKDPIFRARQIGRFLKAAHRRDMKVVAWTVPSFANPQKDYHRARAAILFKGRGHRFDSFGLDIEAAIVGNIWRRNKRLLTLSKQLRELVGPDYTLGAITPDPVKSLYWPDFPYKRVNNIYDVFVPMGYFSFRAHGYKDVKRYTEKSIRVIRRESENPKVPIHLIGGIGGETEVPEVKGFVRAVRGHNVLGASYYDFAVTSEHEWKELETIVDDRAAPDSAPEPSPPPAPEARPTPLPRPEPVEKEQKKRKNGDHKRSKKKNDKHKKKSKNKKNDGRKKKNGKKRERRNEKDKRRRRERRS